MMIHEFNIYDMKYVKKFNESKISYNEILEDIKEILIPITDLGYEISVKLIDDYVHHIFIKILDLSDYWGYRYYPSLELKPEIMDEFLRLNDYVNSNRFEIFRVYYKKVESDGRIFNRHEKDICSYEYLTKELLSTKLSSLTIELKENY